MIRAYLDNNATTKPAAAVVAAMMPYLSELYFNPSSAAGQMNQAAKAVPSAKRAVAGLLGNVDLASGFVLTSGASEANSWVFNSATRQAKPCHLVISAIEHPSVLAAARAATQWGNQVDIAPVDQNGLIEIDALSQLLRPDTALVSIMLANNETGVVQPIGQLAEMIRIKAPSTWIHTDATQAVGKIPVNLDDELREIDLVSMSAHKFHGPKGIGALFIREGLTLDPLIHGEQEDGLRGGTFNSAAAAGLAVAADIASRRLANMKQVALLRDAFEDRLVSNVASLQVNGKSLARLPNTASITIDGTDAKELVDALGLEEVFIATGSACSAGSDKPSHVLTAMGLSYERARSTIRVSLSHETTSAEIDLLYELLTKNVNAMRSRTGGNLPHL